MARLTPEERRKALIAATLPLVRAHGLEVSTRQIADAAGVAEGTIFRVFPDKAALICAAIAHAFDPTPVVDSLNSLPAHLDLRAKLLMAVRVISRRFRENLPLLVATRPSGLVTVRSAGAMMPTDAHASLARIASAVADLVEPHKHQLRYPTQTVAWLLISLLMAQQRIPEIPLATKDIVSVLLDGMSHADQTVTPPSTPLQQADPAGRAAATGPDAGHALPPDA